jgi:pimeloyl-ACP methyl ester carboxylesterase
MKETSIESFDGTRIAYRVGGFGDRWLVIANGYGGTFCAWDDLVERLRDRYRLLVWDYRGLHGSGVPANRNLLRIEHHCRDLDVIREAEGIERAAMAGWSVGVQVALEQYRRSPDSIEALILINGAHGRPLHRSTENPLRRGALSTTVRTLRTLAPVLAPALLPPLRVLAAQPWSGAVLQKVGMFNGNTPSLTASARAILTIDYRVYTHMILLANEHDTEDVLGGIDVPTAVIAGDRDAITPTNVARSTADQIPGCAYREVAGATHYGLMEFPDLYAGYIHELLGS